MSLRSYAERGGDLEKVLDDHDPDVEQTAVHVVMIKFGPHLEDRFTPNTYQLDYIKVEIFVDSAGSEWPPGFTYKGYQVNKDGTRSKRSTGITVFYPHREDEAILERWALKQLKEDS